jgi:uncharacterized RDD family membrane protein YckC
MNHSYASLWRRILAFALDYLVIAAYLLLLVGLSLAANFVFPNGPRSIFSNPIKGEIVGFFLITLPVTLYFALFESSRWQATWGKRVLGLKVIGPEGTGLSRTRALGRTALKFIPWELAHACVWQISFAPQNPSPLIFIGFGLVWVLVGANLVSLLVGKTWQTLYDRIVGSFVVKA